MILSDGMLDMIVIDVGEQGTAIALMKRGFWVVVKMAGIFLDMIRLVIVRCKYK